MAERKVSQEAAKKPRFDVKEGNESKRPGWHKVLRGTGEFDASGWGRIAGLVVVGVGSASGGALMAPTLALAYGLGKFSKHPDRWRRSMAVTAITICVALACAAVVVVTGGTGAAAIGAAVPPVFGVFRRILQDAGLDMSNVAKDFDIELVVQLVEELDVAALSRAAGSTAEGGAA